MKTATCIVTVVAALLMATNSSAIDITAAGPGPMWTFDTAPAAVDWSTGTVVGSNTTINDFTSMDNAIIPLAHTIYSSPVASSATNPPTSTNALFRHNTHQAALWLQSASTGSAATVLKATLNNETPNYVSDLGVTFDFIQTTAETGTTTGPAGYRLYWSATGAAGSWAVLGDVLNSQNYTFNINGLGTSFGDNPLYILWVDDNAEGGTEGQYHIDNVQFMATLGNSIAPGGGSFGSRVGQGILTFEADNSLDLGFTPPGAVIAEPADAQGRTNHALHVNNGSVSLTTEQIDLRGRSSKTAMVDVKVWEDGPTSDFEPNDFIHVVAEYSIESGHIWTPIDILPRSTGGVGIGDPLDQLKALELAGADALGDPHYLHYEVRLPNNALTVRFRIDAANDSVTEHFYFDNLGVPPTLEPEPGSIVMGGLGLLAFVGYAIPRRTLFSLHQKSTKN